MNGEQFTGQECITFQVEHKKIKNPVVEEVIAKEPDLSARPDKPVLKKPGAPSRFRRNLSRKLLSERTSGAVGTVRLDQPLR